MIKRVFKWLIIFLIAFGILQAIQLYAVLHPELFYKYNKKFGPFWVYSSEPINPKFKNTFQEVIVRLEASELYTSDTTIKVVFVNDDFYSKLAGGSVIPRTIGNCVIIGGDVSIESNRLHLPAAKMNLTYILTHEAVHVDQHEEHGLLISTFLDFGRHPSWKIEGYAEWVSQRDHLGDGANSISSSLNLLETTKENSWIDLGDGYKMPSSYLRNRIMIEYLLKIEGMNYSDIIETEISEAELWEKILNLKQNP